MTVSTGPSAGASKADLESAALDGSAPYYKRREALLALLRSGDGAVGVSLCRRLLGDPEKFVRREAARALADHGGSDAAALAGVLADPDEDVRRHAVRGLRATGDAGHAPALRALLSDPSWFLRREVEAAVKELEAKASAPAAPRDALPKPPPLRAPPTQAEPPAPETVVSTRPPPWTGPAPAEAPAPAPHPGLPPRPPPPHVPPPPATRAPVPTPAPAPRPAPARPSPPRPAPPLSAPSRKILEALRQRTGMRPAAPTAAAGTPRPDRLAEVRSALAAKAAVAARALPGASRCPRCGWVLRAGQKFCVFCGTPAGTPPATSVSPLPTTRSAITEGPLAHRRAPGSAPPRPAGGPAGAAAAPARGPNPALVGCGILAAFGFLALLMLGSAMRAAYRRTLPAARPAAPVSRTAPAQAPAGSWVLVELRDGRRERGRIVRRESRSVVYDFDGRIETIPRDRIRWEQPIR